MDLEVPNFQTQITCHLMGIAASVRLPTSGAFRPPANGPRLLMVPYTAYGFYGFLWGKQVTPQNCNFTRESEKHSNHVRSHSYWLWQRQPTGMIALVPRIQNINSLIPCGLEISSDNAETHVKTRVRKAAPNNFLFLTIPNGISTEKPLLLWIEMHRTSAPQQNARTRLCCSSSSRKLNVPHQIDVESKETSLQCSTCSSFSDSWQPRIYKNV